VIRADWLCRYDMGQLCHTLSSRWSATAREESRMLVLIATNESQGAAPDDYACTVEGELVTPIATECSNGDDCGCNRGFPGLASGLATTTAMVVDRPGVTEQDLRDAVHDWLDRGGWIDLLEDTAADRAATDDGSGFAGLDDVDDIVEAIIDEHVETITDVCSSYPPGTVVVRRGRWLSARSFPAAA
jgi:hypothetical protein